MFVSLNISYILYVVCHVRRLLESETLAKTAITNEDPVEDEIQGWY